MADEMNYLLIAFAMLFAIGSLTFIISSFNTLDYQSYNGYLSSVVNFVSIGYNVNITVPVPILPDYNLNFLFNPFGLFGSSIQEFFSTQFIAIGLLPIWLAIPVIIILTSSILFFIIKLLQGFIP